LEGDCSSTKNNLVGWSAMRLREVQVEPSTEVGNGTLRRDNAPR